MKSLHPSASKGVLQGHTFAISTTGVSQKEVEQLISRHDGLLSKIVHRRVHFLITTDAAVEKNTQAVRKARDKYGIPLVRLDFLYDSIAKGGLQDASAYAPSEPKPGKCITTDTTGTTTKTPSLAALGVGSNGRLEVLVELSDLPDQWWPVRLVSDTPSGRYFDIVYEALPEVGYEEETPSKARFDPAGREAVGLPEGAMGQLWDGDEQIWRPWRRPCATAKDLSASSTGRVEGVAPSYAPLHGAATDVSTSPTVTSVSSAALSLAKKHPRSAASDARCDQMQSLSKAQRKRARRRATGSGTASQLQTVGTRA